MGRVLTVSTTVVVAAALGDGVGFTFRELDGCAVGVVWELGAPEQPASPPLATATAAAATTTLRVRTILT
ncbi:MAG: hypothetical protein WCB86_10670 [Candidatus Dormiibacterota bacterium]